VTLADLGQINASKSSKNTIIIDGSGAAADIGHA
jgi:hypothetical protein